MKSKNPRPLILTIFENSKYQELLSHIDADFIFYKCSGSKNIDQEYKNSIILSDITPNVKPDIFLCQNILTQYSIFHELASENRKPLLALHHNVPTSPAEIDAIYGLKFSKEIYYSVEHSYTWESRNSEIIPPTVFKKSSIINYCLYLNNNRSFSNCLDILEAMSNGNCVVSKPDLEVRNIINNGYNGFLYLDPKDEKSIVEKLLKNKDLITEVGKNAIKTIDNKYSNENFIKNWNSLIYHYYNKE